MFIKDKLSKTNSKINIDDIDLEIVEKKSNIFSNNKKEWNFIILIYL